jgi:hypothetical protein
MSIRLQTFSLDHLERLLGESILLIPRPNPENGPSNCIHKGQREHRLKNNKHTKYLQCLPGCFFLVDQVRLGQDVTRTLMIMLLVH